MRPVNTKACKKLFLLILSLSFVWLFIACQEQNTYVEPPPPKVTVAQPLEQAVTDYLDFVGSTHPVKKVEIRARVSGFLQSMHFTPGTKVNKGDLLFTIEQTEYKARLSAAQSEMNAAKSQFKRAETEFKRMDKLYKQKAAAQKDVVKWQGERDIAKAAATLANSKIERARLDLSYTKVTAPISGRVGRNLVDMGNLVGSGESTLLTTVTQYNPMYAYFNLNERDLLKVMALYRKEVEEKGIDPDTDSDKEAQIPVFLGLANEKGYPHKGVLDFAESGLDPGTGTIQLRGVFPNPGKTKALLPGLFVRIRFPVSKIEKALLVSERAIGFDQGGKYLLVVNNENTVEKRPIRMGQITDGLAVIVEGIQSGERVIVNGLQRARPGAKVDPESVDMKSLTVSSRKAATPTAEKEASARKESTKKDTDKSAPMADKPKP